MTAVPSEVIRLGDVGSTNDEAMARLRADANADAFWITAERQLAGRGRRGRPWTSEPGNLYATFGFRPALPAPAMGLLPLAASLALADAVPAGVKPQLKWPNDVLVGGAKCAGILIETEYGAASGERRAVIGFGVNIAHHPDDTGATHLAGHDPAITPQALFDALRPALADALAVLAAPEGLAEIRRRWVARAVGIGGSITVRYEREILEGQFLGLDPSGRLILGQQGGVTRLIAAGDVFVRSERL